VLRTGGGAGGAAEFDFHQGKRLGAGEGKGRRKFCGSKREMILRNAPSLQVGTRVFRVTKLVESGSVNLVAIKE
jgi:hypothetical protein